MATNPWDRQPKESRQAYEAFRVYRDLGPDRSPAEVARRLGKSQSLIEHWSSRWRWVFRADQWDAHLQRLVDDEIRRRAVAEAERHKAIYQGLLAAAAASLARLNEQLRAVDVRVDPRAAALLAVEAVRLGRLLMGEAEPEEGSRLRIVIDEPDERPDLAPR